jgi:hypothetical protein
VANQVLGFGALLLSGRKRSVWRSFLVSFATRVLRLQDPQQAGRLRKCSKTYGQEACCVALSSKLSGAVLGRFNKSVDNPLNTSLNTSIPSTHPRIDVLKQGGVRIGIESKVGRTSLTARVKQELARDWWLRRQGKLDDVWWEFSRSTATGKARPTPELADKLRKLAFRIAGETK